MTNEKFSPEMLAKYYAVAKAVSSVIRGQAEEKLASGELDTEKPEAGETSSHTEQIVSKAEMDKILAQGEVVPDAEMPAGFARSMFLFDSIGQVFEAVRILSFDDGPHYFDKVAQATLDKIHEDAMERSEIKTDMPFIHDFQINGKSIKITFNPDKAVDEKTVHELGMEIRNCCLNRLLKFGAVIRNTRATLDKSDELYAAFGEMGQAFAEAVNKNDLRAELQRAEKEFATRLPDFPSPG